MLIQVDAVILAEVLVFLPASGEVGVLLLLFNVCD
jgi:hypothetical protein